jgi:23S rRNA pseudouridine1911/1915/1917 synthase
MNESRRIVATVEDEGTRLDQFIARHAPALSRSQAQRLIKEGRVHLSHGAAKASLPVEAGVIVDIDVPGAAPTLIAAEALPLEILHDDADIVVVNKPAGMVVHPAVGHAGGTLVNALLHHVSDLSGIGGRERPGIVHRLDRGTSGVMVAAKNDAAHRALTEQFQAREIGKEYLALVWGTVRAGESFDQPIGRHRRERQKMTTRAPRARTASTRILESEPLGGVTLVRVGIATGRTHQIRVHLSESGHPVVGDELYGGAGRKPPPGLGPLSRVERPFLHAFRLTLRHPSSGDSMTFEAPLAPDLEAVLSHVRRIQGR